MRLIDADEMNEELFYQQVGGKDALISAECAFNMIKAQPTAYDVEKVVSKINRCSGNGYRDVDGDYVPSMIETGDAIRIIAEGGVED